MPFRIPLSGLLSHQLLPTGSTNDLLAFDNSLFDNLKLPDGVEKVDVVNCILEKHGCTALAHPDPVWLKHYIGVWSKRRLYNWQKLYDTLNLEYNPIENYDRKEDITDTTQTDRTTAGKASGNNTEATTEKRTEDTTLKHDVSAENAADYQPDNRDITTGNSAVLSNRNIGTTSETSGTEGITETYVHTNRTHGNIGVTTSQQMIEAERSLVRYSLIEEIAEDYRDAFCLDIY